MDCLPAPVPIHDLHHVAHRCRDAGQTRRFLRIELSAHARLAEQNERKCFWRTERAAGRAASVLKPQRNDRPEVAERARPA